MNIVTFNFYQNSAAQILSNALYTVQFARIISEDSTMPLEIRNVADMMLTLVKYHALSGEIDTALHTLYGIIEYSIECEYRMSLLRYDE